LHQFRRLFEEPVIPLDLVSRIAGRSTHHPKAARALDGSVVGEAGQERQERQERRRASRDIITTPDGAWSPAISSQLSD